MGHPLGWLELMRQCAPATARWKAFKGKEVATVTQAVEALLDGHITLWDYQAALCWVRVGCPALGSAQELALMVWEAYQIADGVKPPEYLSGPSILAVWVAALPLDQRARLYYDLCNCLGYDPAEDGPPPRRLTPTVSSRVRNGPDGPTIAQDE